MTVTIQIRDVPETVHRTLKSRAALAGKSLSDYLRRELQAMTERPALDEMRARLQERTATTPPIAPADLIRRKRDAG